MARKDVGWTNKKAKSRMNYKGTEGNEGKRCIEGRDRLFLRGGHLIE